MMRTLFLSCFLILSLAACSGEKDKTSNLVDEKEGIPLYFNIANEYIGLGLMDKARAEIEKVLKIDPNFSEAYERLGYIASLEKNKDEAIRYYEKAISVDPKNTHAYQLISLEYIQSGEKEKAKEEHLKAESFSPDMVVLSYLGNIYFAEGDYDKAEGYLKRAIELSVDYHTPYVTLAKIAQKKDQNSKAIEYLNKAIKMKPKSVDAHLTLAGIYLAGFDLEKAQEEYEKTLSIDPSMEGVYNHLAFIYAERGVKLNDAMVLVKKGIEKLGEEGKYKYFDTLSWVHYKKGELKEAQKVSDELLGYMKGKEIPASYKGMLLYHRGMIDIALHERNKGEKELKDALSLGIIDRYRKSAKKILNSPS